MAPVVLADSESPARPVEGMLLDWPDEEGWKAANKQENSRVQMIEIVRGEETVDNWTELGTMISNKGTVLPSIAMGYETYKTQLEKTCPGAVFEIRDVEADAEYPRMIFTFSCERTPKDGHAESAVWLLMQGKQSLYVAQRAIRSARIPEDLCLRWIEWLKTARVVVR
ncbi:hypothetical protein [Solimonas sp. K1W22B-7]|uniref:hypothetical protein n=1 Tax=Solimonas sp. K1W22B-7 TaxID=2303331 RepID=UPI0013C514B9|nr:hypothetical protein [Solimonas sp. K1W22B-7]